MALNARQIRRRRRFQRAFIGFAGLDSGLGVDAPSSVQFGEGDQPVILYDYEAHNYVTSPGDFTNAAWLTVNSATKTDADTIAAALGGASVVYEVFSTTEGQFYECYARVTQDATTSGAGRFPAIYLVSSGVNNNLLFAFDSSAADTNNNGGTVRGLFDANYVTITVDDIGPGSSWDIKIRFKAPGTTLSFGFCPAFGQTEASLSGKDYNTLFDIGASGSLDVTRQQFRFLSSPDTYTASNTAPVASYGDIQFSDSLYDATDDAYKLTLSITGGDLTLAQTTGLTFVTGDGTADASMVFTGTLNNINLALVSGSDALSINNASTGQETITYRIERTSTGALLVGTINVTIASFLLLSDGSSFLLLSDGTSKLKLSG